MRSKLTLTVILLGLLLLSGACFFQTPSERPDVLLITIDTLRADRLGPYGAEDVKTPVIDGLAREGVVFEQAAAPMGLTLPSHFSIFTGKYPREHGVMNHGMVLLDEEQTLTEAFRDAGYRTAGFVGVNLLSPGSGANQGFEEFDFPKGNLQLPASQVVPKALRWLGDREEDEKVFLWVHLFDPHLPYAPPKPYNQSALERSEGRFPSLHWPQFLRVAKANNGDIPLWVLDHAKALYDAEVELTDHWVGRLIDGFKERRSWEDTLVVLTADHGECFSNGVYFEHADCLYDGAIRVPLIVLYPKRQDAGKRVEGLASLIDVAPTVLAAAGLQPLEGASGRVVGVDQTIPEDRGVLIQHPFYRERPAERRKTRQQTIRSVGGVPVKDILTDAERVGLMTRDWKYIRSTDSEELFARHPVVDEGNDVASGEPEALKTLRQRLRTELARHPLNLAAPEELDDELRQALEALGYL
jgi:arylsulfatase A-like enzyme